MSAETPQYQDSLGAHIGRTGKVLSAALVARFRAAGYDYFTLDHWIVLLHLWHKDGQNQQYLGESAGRNKTTITRAIDSLEQRDFVVRIPDKDDRRNKLIYLTHGGRKLHETLMPLAEEVVQEATMGIPTTDIDTCKSVLNYMFQRLREHI
ncbi:MAG: hypothetical protein OHK0039_02380 [Bacteroidia bacterium]